MFNSLDKPFSSPPGVYPPTTVRWTAFFTTTPPGASIWRVPFQPGAPSGLLIPIEWIVTDIWFRIENPASSGNSTLQIQRSTGNGGFSSVNLINDTPVVIAAGAWEPALQPSPIDNPIVNSGDKLQPVFSLGLGASVVSMAIVLTQSPVI